MAFIETIPVAQATGAVRELYERAQAGPGYVPNYAKLFSLRPEVNAAWGALRGSIRGHMEPRRYELVTLAAARALRCAYCALAHGKVLDDKLLAPGQLEALLRSPADAGLTLAEVAVMAFAERVARDATSVTEAEVRALREQGLTDAEVFDVAAAAAARCFFSKLLDALGAEPDAAYAEQLDAALLDPLAMERPVSTSAVERLEGHPPS